MNAIGGAATFATGMGLASAYDNQSVQENTFRTTSKTKLDKMSDAERNLLDSLSGLGMDQNAQVRRLLGSSASSFALTPEEQAQLNQMYAGSEAALMQYGQQLGQDIMGRSGLTGSSTPVTQAVMREMLPAMAALQQSKMGTGFGLGLQAKRLGLDAALGMPGATGFGLQRYLQERLATGRTTTSGSTRGTINPGFLDRLATASGAQKNFTGAGKDLMSGSGADMAAFGLSDERLKRDIAPVAWKWNGTNNHEYLGVIAQQVEQSHPHLVKRDRDGYLMVDYGTMVAMLLNEREQLYAQLAEAKG